MIRAAAPEDAERIHHLMLAAFTPFRDQYTDGCFDATVLDPDRIRGRMQEGPVLIAETDRLAGTVSVVLDERGMYVRGMAVHPEARRTGVGSALLDAAEQIAREQRAPCLWLSTTRFLTASQALYRAHGFQTSDGPSDLFGTPLVSFQKEL